MKLTKPAYAPEPLTVIGLTATIGSVVLICR